MFRLLCILGFYGDGLIDYLRKTQDHKERRITPVDSLSFSLMFHGFKNWSDRYENYTWVWLYKIHELPLRAKYT